MRCCCARENKYFLLSARTVVTPTGTHPVQDDLIWSYRQDACGKPNEPHDHDTMITKEITHDRGKKKKRGVGGGVVVAARGGEDHAIHDHSNHH